MNDLIDRYVYQVGLYVHPKERKDIEAELRSQIQDQIEDQFGGVSTRDDVAVVLKQLGDPRTMAASYSGDQYLVGPELYTFMMTVLRIGLPLVPAVVVIANILGALLSPEGADWIGLLIGSIFTALHAALIFFAIVVLIFTILQHAGETIQTATDTTDFDPLKLPAANQPGAVDRFESGFGIAVLTLIGIAVAYFLLVGGLTLRFNLNDPGEVLPVPTVGLVIMLITTFGGVGLHLLALIRGRWNFVTWLVKMLFDTAGPVGLYLAVLSPIAERVQQSLPELSAALPIAQLPWLITLTIVVLVVLVDGTKLIRLWQQRPGASA